jgi:pimeloyl-ACP methyl ester carboxylesterase
MKTMVLLHGAWNGPWCWKKITPLLTAEGYTVITPAIPWTYDQNSKNKRPDLNSIANEFSDLLEYIEGEFTLVGHSLGGLLASLLSYTLPEKISTIFYISGFILKNGQTVNDLESHMTDSMIANNLAFDEQTRSLIVPEYILKTGFYHDCDDLDFQFAKQRLRPQIASTFLTQTNMPQKLSSRVRKIYVECQHDKAVPVSVQKIMQKNIHFDEIFKLPTSHSPFFSYPDKLVDLLLSVK